MVITVRSSAELLDALRTATGGDTIALAPGDYGGVTIRNVAFDTPVRITSADPGAPAIISGRMMVRDSAGLVLENLDFRASESQPAATNAQLHILGSQRIAVVDSTIAGRIAGEGEGLILEDIARGAKVSNELVEGHAAGHGIFVRNSADVSLSGLDVSLVRTGLAIQNADRVSLTDSHFHDIRRDGVTITEASDVRIEDNLFHSFHPLELAALPNGKDHSDFIQYWGTNGSRGIDGLEIAGNAFLQGSGGSMQGIFGRLANRDAGPELQFRNFSIHDNVINVSHANALLISDVIGLDIRDNSLVAAPLDAAALRWSGAVPKIRVTSERTTAEAAGGQDNVAPRDVTISGNLIFGGGRDAVIVQTIDPADHAKLGVVVRDNISQANLGPRGDLLATPLTDLAAVTGLPAGGAAPLKDWIVAAASRIDVTAPGKVFGTSGNDTLDASPEAGIDTSRLYGGDGDDLIRGGDQRDSIVGGAGSDTMTGGARGDSFYLTASRDGAPDVDVITDFDFDEGDAIVLSANFPTRFFRDDADPDNPLNVFEGGRVAVLNREADIAELTLNERVDLVETDEGRELRFDFDGNGRIDYTLRLPAAAGPDRPGSEAPGHPPVGGGRDEAPAEDEPTGEGGPPGEDDPEVEETPAERDGAWLRSPDFVAGETLVFDGFPAGFFADLDLPAPAGVADGSAAVVASWRDVAVLASMDGVSARALSSGEIELTFGPEAPAEAEIVVQVAGLSREEAAKLVDILAAPSCRIDVEALDRIRTFGADDTIFGLEGADDIRGHRGDDWIHGGLGDDKLVGGAGSDTVFGGEGRDRFVITAREMEAGDRDVFADLDFGAGDTVYLTGFKSGTFPGGWYDGGVRLVRSVEELVGLGSLPGFTVTAAADGGVELSVATAGGPAFVELQLDPGSAAAALDLLVG